MNDVLERAAPGFRPKVALILGSGLGSFVEEVTEIATIPYAELPGFPQPTTAREVPVDDPKFSGFIFKIQADRKSVV